MRARVLAVLALAAAVVAGVLVLSGGAGGGHRLVAGFDSAIQMTPGQEVRIAGRRVGEVREVRLVDGKASVELEIDDEDVWPLPKGTIARTRWGSTTAYLGRYTELVPGPDGGGTLEDGAILASGTNSTAFELDEAYRLLRGRTKEDLGEALERLGGTFGGRDADLRRGVAAAPGGLDETASLLRELAEDEERLRTLAEAGDRTLTTLAGRSDDLGALVADAASTFSELAEHATAQQRALDRAPRAFATSTRTLARLDRTLEGLDGLVADLRPGAPALRRLAVSAKGALAELRAVAPKAATTLAAGTASAPSLTRLVRSSTPVLPKAGEALGGLAPMLACLRPYAPEIAGFLTTWTGQTTNFDQTGHYARSFPVTVIPALLPGTSNDSLQATRMQPGIRYAMPRPPGLNAGAPWFQPQCGAGPDSLDPAKDPERAR